MRFPVALTVQSHPRLLAVVRDVVSRLADSHGLSEAVRNDLRLAVDEACANVIRHAYGGDTTQKIGLKFSATENEFRVIIEDTGKKAGNEAFQGRDFDDVRPGGLGMHFIRRAFDSVFFDPKKKNGNRLVLIKRWGEEFGENRNK